MRASGFAGRSRPARRFVRAVLAGLDLTSSASLKIPELVRATSWKNKSGSWSGIERTPPGPDSYDDTMSGAVSESGRQTMKDWSLETIASPFRRQAADALRKARALPIGPERNDLRQLAIGLLGLERKGFDAKLPRPTPKTAAVPLGPYPR
jgi:hypothetical protein